MTIEELLTLLHSCKALEPLPIFVVLVEREKDGYRLLDYGLYRVEDFAAILTKEKGEMLNADEKR